MELIMTSIPYRNALIVGAGSGISASVARGLAAAGLKVGLAARNIEKLAPLAAEIGAERFVADAADPAAVARLFEEADARLGAPEVVLYNASSRAPGPIAELDPEMVRKAVEISAFGGFLVIQQAVRRMIPKGQGAILLTGASASVKGYPLSAAFAMGKFALRGLAQSVARELGPKGIHVAHFVIDGGVRSGRRPDPANRPDSTLDPDGIAQTYLEVLRQPRSAWSLEVELRPWVETF
jgi:NAD(P)-dependent dehydrogenase (short-subunit alcohol dehydrogenase family)